MRHVAVRRLAVLLGAVFLLWAGIFAWVVRRSPAEEPPAGTPPVAATSLTGGAALFERHCSTCHALADMRSTIGAEVDDARRAELGQFMEGHGDASTDENRQILDFLAAAP